LRLFVALELPAPVVERIAERVERERAELPPASWVPPPNLHATLAFFGEVDAAAVELLARRLSRAVASASPFEARLDGCGAFPRGGPVRVVWLGIEPAEPLRELAERIRGAAEEVDVPVDEKAFHAHVTLARCRRPWPARERRRLDLLAPAGELVVPAERVALVSSELAAGGSRYTTVARLPLGADA